MFQRRQGLGAAPRPECYFGQGPPGTFSPRESRLWLAPQGTQESAEISKYWLWPHVSGCRKGKEKVWACETLGRSNRRNAITAAAGEMDHAAIASLVPPRPVTMVQSPEAGPSPSPHQPLQQLRRADWTTPARFRKCLHTLPGC